jgi:hypothetical protein
MFNLRRRASGHVRADLWGPGAELSLLAARHSITSSAIASSVAGMIRPSAILRPLVRTITLLPALALGVAACQLVPVLMVRQSGERPERYAESLRFDTIPSSPILQACAKTVAPSPSMCSLNRMPGLALATIGASVALRTSSGSCRRSSPFSSIRSKAYRNVLSSWRR